ncbi:MAG: arginine N-succinyltransferase [Actinomycetota bacterium]
MVRPVREDDLGALLTLAGSLEAPLTTLPSHAGNLEARVETSLRSFDPRIRTPGPEYYMFVLEDAAGGRVLGTCALMGRVGGFDPSYTYEVRRERSRHEPLGIRTDHEVLHLRREHKGPSEIGGLALHPDGRARGLGRLLSLSRFLFVHAHPQRFADRVIAELRGRVDAQGRSPFWEAVGRHFFQRDLAEADLLSGLGDKQFIEDLMPRHPIYTCLLPEEARQAIGRVHRETEPARALLDGEGFTELGEVDIFDAGPVLTAATAEIRTIRAARRAPVARLLPDPPQAPPVLLANGALDFRACIAPAPEGGDGVDLWARTARLLGVAEGDEVTTAPLRGERE